MRITVIWAVLLSAVGAPGVAAQDSDRAEWWSVEQRVAEELLTRDVGQWARELNEQPLPAAAGELMQRFSVLNRAGHLRQVRRVIDALSDAKVEPNQLSTMADFLIDRREWSTARYFLERLPHATPGWGYVLIKEWASTGDAKQIDAWLVERAKANPRYWLRERLRFRNEQGTADELVEELARHVRRQPQNVEIALQFLEATEVIRHSPDDIDWLGEVCRPPSAYPSLRLGKALRSSPRAAIALLDHSLAMPFTKQDAAELQAEMSHWARAVPAPELAPPELEKQIRYETKRELLTALHAVGQSARAQKLLEELAARQPDGLPPGGFDRLAGQVQAASGARVVQQRFQEAEPENEQSARYWQRRAAYYTGRKEHSEVIAAYEKAMRLSTPDSDNPTARVSGTELRSSVLSSYVHFLEHSQREESAARLLESELRDAPLEGMYAQRIVDLLLGARRSTLVALEERLWAYLAARPQWGHREQRLLWRLVEPLDNKPQQSWQRAEELARDGDPSRSLVLGWVMTRSKASERAIAWLKSAWQRLEEPDERERAAFNLFSAYLDIDDWRSAEEMWPHARKQLTAKEFPDWLGRIAVAAARAGDQAEALRLWKRRTNLDRASTSYLDDMVRASLREPLTAFYRALAVEDPECQSIEPVIAHLRSQN